MISVEMDARSIILLLRRRWLPAIVAMAIVLTLVGVFLAVVSPRYTAIALLQVDPRSLSLVSPNAEDNSSRALDRPVLENEIELLRSEAFAAKVVDRLKLTNDPEFGADFSGKEQVSDEVAAQRNRTRAALRLLDNVKIAQREASSVVAISAVFKDPEKAARIANAFAEAYITDQLEGRLDNAQRTTDWLSQRMSELRDKVESSERAVAAFRTEHNLTTAHGVTLSDQQLADLNSQLILAGAHRAEAEAKLAQAEALMDSDRTASAIADVLNSPVISQLKIQLAEVRRRESEIVGRYGPGHPLGLSLQLASIRAERADLEANISREIGQVVASLRNEAEVARAREKALKASLGQAESSVGATDQIAVQLRELERDSETSRMLYESLMRRFKQMREQATVRETSARIVSKASRPLAPSFPKVWTVFAIALFAAPALGFGAAVLADRLDDTVTTGKIVERDLGVPCLALIPFAAIRTDSAQPSKAVPKDSPICDMPVLKPFGILAESLRMLKSALDASNLEETPKVILVTSAAPGEGKTTLSIMLGRTIAAANRKVLLVDLDLRRAAATKMLKIEAEQDITTILTSELLSAGAIKQDQRSGMHFVPGRRGSSVSTELLESPCVRDFLRAAREHYDVILIDAPPVLAVNDARILARLADVALLVVRWNSTKRDFANSSLSVLRSMNVRVAGVALNAVNMDRQAHYDHSEIGYYCKRYADYFRDAPRERRRESTN